MLAVLEMVRNSHVETTRNRGTAPVGQKYGRKILDAGGTLAGENMLVILVKRGFAGKNLKISVENNPFGFWFGTVWFF